MRAADSLDLQQPSLLRRNRDISGDRLSRGDELSPARQRQITLEPPDVVLHRTREEEQPGRDLRVG
jgi:hypothetical protein